jgi:DNA invertase Pin-like site-specific DNA recombinase
MKAIYIRISSSKQNIERQRVKDKNVKYYVDVCSGSIPFNQRPGALNLIGNDNVNEVEIKEITRLGRNLSDILKTVDYFTEKKVNIFIENQGLSTLLKNGKKNPTASLLINMLASIGDYERDLINERVREGVNIAVAKGKYKGKKKGTIANIENYKSKHFKDIKKIKELLYKDFSIKKIAEITNVPRSRIYLYKKKDLI